MPCSRRESVGYVVVCVRQAKSLGATMSDLTFDFAHEYVVVLGADAVPVHTHIYIDTHTHTHTERHIHTHTHRHTHTNSDRDAHTDAVTCTQTRRHTQAAVVEEQGPRQVRRRVDVRARLEQSGMSASSRGCMSPGLRQEIEVFFVFGVCVL